MRIILPPALLILLLTACTADPPADPLVGSSCIYATQNPVVANEISNPGKNKILLPGDIVTVTDSTIELDRLYYPQNLTVPRYDSLKGGDSLPVAVRLTKVEAATLNVDLLREGQVELNRYFTPLDTSFKLISARKLAGQTYRYQPAGGGSELLFVGYSGEKIGNKPKSYFVEFLNDWHVPQSRLLPGRKLGGMFGPFTAIGLEAAFLRMASQYVEGSFGKGMKRLYEDGEGNFLVQVFDVENGKHRLQYVYLEAVPGEVPSDIADSFLGSQLINANFVVDADYPVVDSASVAFANLDGVAGEILERSDLADLDLSFNEDGSFFFLAREEVFMTGTWRLSGDHNWLLIETKNATYPKHFPILSYDDSQMTFRMPLRVRTRSPRGVNLPSYGSIDAIVTATFQ